MATGVLVLGVGLATRLLSYITEGKKLLLAPRFLFGNVNGVRNPLEDALIAIGGGADVTKTLADTSKTIKSNLGA